MTDVDEKLPVDFDELPDAPPKKRIQFSLTGKVAIVIVGFWVLMAFIGPFVAPYDEAAFLSDSGYAPIGKACSKWEDDLCFTNVLGTDYLGRDTFSRIIWGARTTIGISFVATMLAYLIGVTLGIFAAIGSSRVDMVLSRTNDALISIPSIMLGLVVVAAIGSSIPVLIISAGVIFSTVVFRISRALAMEIKVTDFVEAARARGEGLGWITRREILPNIIMPLATDFGIRLVYIILFISGLSFLGLGVQPPMADWGSMVRENLQGIGYGSIAPIAPSIAIASLTISLNLIVDDISAHAGGKLSGRMI
ncbi:ABC transporter permease [Roseovarius sp. 2305UL8-3]|uniref:ABC transporter permease n=1 Tax=Roseovarius conchicola TaxID=3121636 RepID=UPI0035271BA7